MTLLWGLWYSRNQFVHEVNQRSALELVAFVGQFVSQRIEILKAHIGSGLGRKEAIFGSARGAVRSTTIVVVAMVPVSGREESTIMLPEEVFIRFNFDAAFSEDGLRVGIGFGVRMHNGLFARRIEALDHPLAPQSAEAYAIRVAVHWAVLQG